MSDKPGSILGGILLIGGSCIGAGMLGLPILTGLAGFIPSTIMFVAAWLFMTITGLLLVEVNGWFSTQVNIISMAGLTLGRAGRLLSWTLYLFLFYALLVAYISGSGSLSTTFFHLPAALGSLFFTVLFGAVVYLGTRQVDLWNRILMIGMIITYAGLVYFGFKMIDGELLKHSVPSYAFFSLPILVVSFGYHNMIPTLTAYMKGDLKRVRYTIIGGGILALVIYLIWEIIVLGIVPKETIHESYRSGQEGSQALASILGSSWITTCAQWFALFAILTSFLAQALSLVHFLADGFKIKHEKKENVLLCIAALVPPLTMSFLDPELFLKALSFGGGIAALLFGVFPVCMVWIGRYRKQLSSTYQVMGGKTLLLIILAFSLLIVIFQISSMAGAKFLPKP